jgi:GR25 family glycosyltransferase involved in LPS biosynthesis
MKSFAIIIKSSETSELGYSTLVESSKKVGNNFDINRFDAITPKTYKQAMLDFNISWNYPWRSEVLDFASGLKKKAYVTSNPENRIACAISHYALWKKCVELDEPILILEHDAFFIQKIDFNPKDVNFTILGINNPLGVTRLSKVYYDSILNNMNLYQLVPYVDSDRQVPQGLAGNSAYIIKPTGANHLIGLVKEYGLWPNDAIMCRQLVTGLGVTKKFYTNTQKLKSTTT